MSLTPEGRGLPLPNHSSTSLQVTEYGAESISDASERHTGRRLFACPYAQRDPSEYEDSPSCSRSGWTTIHRLRQHIYRCHILPIRCPGCSQNFESGRLYTQHIRTESHCGSGHDDDDDEGDDPMVGLESLVQKIRPTKSTKAEPSEEDMWKVLYTTLFPDDPKDQLPYAYYEGDQIDPNIISPFGDSMYRAESLRSGSSLREVHAAPSVVSMYSQATSVSGEFSRESPLGEDPSNMPQGPQESKTSKLKKKIKRKTLDAQIAGFKVWEKPHRTDEHITPGAYHSFWKWLARCFTFFIPSWFLKKAYKMDDIRQRLAYRQKVLFCILLAAIYVVLAYFLVIQPVVSCVVKAPIGMFSNSSPFCHVVRDIIYIYMGMGGAFMLLVACCVVIVRYSNRGYEEHDKLLVMHMPCYNENEATLRKTIESCVDSTYEKKRKLLFIVADGTVAAAGQKPTYKILLEDIFDHSADLEAGIDEKARTYTSFDLDGASDNLAFCCTGYFRKVPYVLIVKVGRDDEQNTPKPGNRGKRDSQLLVYNFFHYVNYRRFWSPLFENLEFKMRNCLNMDAREAEYMLVVDCDTEVERTGISYLVHQLQKDAKLLGVCGYTGVSNTLGSFVASSQVFEYWLTHAVLKAVESTCTNVLVLSGCFTIYRLKWSNNQPGILHPLLLEDYAGTYDKTLHEHNLLSIGEDRYLSTLAIRYFGADCRLRYYPAAKCTTVVPENLSVLLDQRRRWTNSLIHCHFAHLMVLPFEASFWTNIRLLFIIFAELFMVFILPLALPAGLVLAIISLLLTSYAWVILLVFLLLPLILCIICMDWVYIPSYLPFFPMIAVFSIIIPIFSAWQQDNIKWGKTRGG